MNSVQLNIVTLIDMERATETGSLSESMFMMDNSIGGDGQGGEGGPISFLASGEEGASDGGTPILVAGEQAGVALPFGCRMGICHTCVGRLCSGRVRDLRTGKVSGSEGEMVRTCINAPEGPVEIDL